MASDIHLTVVIPVFNEQKSIPELSRRLTSVCRRLKKGYEILFVDDGSKDGTGEAIKEAKKEDRNIFGLHLEKNSGKSNAYSAGFDAARGEVIITMDGDLQDRPEQIPEFLNKIEEGYDLVTGWKYTGKGKRTWSSRLFNRFVAKLTGLTFIHDTNCPFKAYRKEVVDTTSKKGVWIYSTLYRFIPALAYWKGYKIAEIKVENDLRKYGQTKFGPGRWVHGGLDLMTIVFLTLYIKRPIYWFGTFGLLVGAAGFLIDLILVTIGLINGRIGHYALLALGLVFVTIGIQSVFTGLMLEMNLRLYEEQRREVPVYKKI